jgi:predicted phosphoribosyltransferase/dienelactone hydrolase
MLGRHDAIEDITVHAGSRELRGSLGVPQGPVGLVVLAGTDNRLVAEALRARGLATLTIDVESLEADNDLDALASDLLAISEWVRHSNVSHLPLGYLGADCFAAAAVVAAAREPDIVRALVALGGRIDTAGPALASVSAPTLLICGLDDDALIERDREAIEQMTTATQLAIIPGAFSDPAMSDEVIQLAAEWLVDHFAVALQESPARRGAWGRQFRDRRCAGERLAALLESHRRDNVIVFGLPRGGVVVADEIARALGAPLDVWLVRKIGMPIQPELGMGALAEGAALILDPTTVKWSGATPEDLQTIVHAKAAEIRRRATLYRGDAPPPDIHGKTVILVDDGVATGATLRAAIRGARKRGARRIIVAVPVAAAEAVAAIEAEADELVCIAAPKNSISVGGWYQDFRQVPESDVVAILEAARSVAAA